MKPNERAMELALVTALLDRVKPELVFMRDAVTDDLLALKDSVGAEQVKVRLPDGTVVATATLVLGDTEDQGINIDQDAFLAWVKQHHPTEVMETVRPAFATAFKDRLVITEHDVIDTTTGEAVTYAVPVAKRPAKPSMRLLFAGAAKGRELIVEAWRRGEIGTPKVLALGTGEDE